MRWIMNDPMWIVRVIGDDMELKISLNKLVDVYC